MRWLTQAEVKKAAVKSKRAAIASCKKVWYMNYTATEKEIKRRDAGEAKTGNGNYCALCVRYKKNRCKGCPLFRPRRSSACCREWDAFAAAYIRWHYNEGGRFLIVQKKAKLMYERLCKL